MSARPHHATTLFRSFTAGILCALVLGLGLLAHSPSAHAWLHAIACETGLPHSHGDSAHEFDAQNPLAPNHVCAITAFAQGAETPAAAPVLIAPLSVFVVALKPKSEIRLTRTEHLLPPGRGPPSV